MDTHASQPIGIFDSGIGGLTIAHAVKYTLPNESIIYFGDTAHLPYGDKPTSIIQAYANKIGDILLQKHCKVIVIACNSAAAAAYDSLKAHVGKRTKVLNVIDPMIDYVRTHYKGRPIGLIGTKQTIQSGVYKKKIQALRLGIQLKSLATPLLASMIEEGFVKGAICQKIIDDYLKRPHLKGICALILGCTHYPVIRKQIQSFYQSKVSIIDASKLTALSLKAFLTANQLLNPGNETTDHFMVSDFSKDFEKTTRIFFKRKVYLEQVAPWD